MFRDDGCRFGFALIDSCPVRIHDPQRDVPIVRVLRRHVGPDLVVSNDSFLLHRFQGRLQVLPEVLPERLALAGLDVVVGDTPNWPKLVVWILPKAVNRTEQRHDKQRCTHCFFHNASSWLTGNGAGRRRSVTSTCVIYKGIGVGWPGCDGLFLQRGWRTLITCER